LGWDERKILVIDVSLIQIDRPIFLIGLPRSGTTILQDIICTHPSVAYITNVMQAFQNSVCAAEDLRKRIKLDFDGQRYLGDGVNVKAGSPNEGMIFFADWFRLDLYSLDYVERQIEDFSDEEIKAIRETIKKIMWSFGGQADRFFNKNPAIIPHVLLLKDMFPGAKIVHIIRDARMCAKSMVKLCRLSQAQETRIRARSANGHYSDDLLVPYPRLPRLAEYINCYGADDVRTTAHLWNDAISFVDERKDQLPDYYEVRFEDILANPKEEIFKVLEFCELPDVKDDNIGFWKKLSQIGVVQHSNKYGDFELVEEICRANLQKYGYL
jgi:hypothetical protein